MVGNFDDTKCLRSFFQEGAGSENEMTAQTRPYGEEFSSSKDMYAVDGILYPPPLEQQGQLDIFQSAIKQVPALKMHKQSSLPEQY